MLTTSQCQNPLPVGASGSKQVTAKLLVPVGAPDQARCGERLSPSQPKPKAADRMWVLARYSPSLKLLLRTVNVMRRLPFSSKLMRCPRQGVSAFATPRRFRRPRSDYASPQAGANPLDVGLRLLRVAGADMPIFVIQLGDMPMTLPP